MPPLPPHLSALYVYPVKSARPLSHDQVAVEPWGLAGDRCWALAGPGGRCVTQREKPRLALVRALPRPGGGLRLGAPGAEPLEVAVPGQAGDVPGPVMVPIRIFGKEVKAVPAQDAAHSWFSRYLGAEVSLVYLDDPARRRPIDPEYGLPGETVTLADGFPLLLTTTASLAALRGLIAEEAAASGAAAPGPLPMNRFRPNVVIEATEPWAEDGWRRVRIGEVAFRVAKPCARCVVTTVDQETARRGAEPLRTLGRHRRFGSRLMFGQHLVPEHTGVLRVGDPLTVLA